jgi:SAM-dependent methyltransferase
VRWLAKAALVKLGSLPGAAGPHYFVQRHVTRSLPTSNRVFLRKARRAARHLEVFETHGPRRPLERCVHYEFGAGWELIAPLVLWSLGIERQILVDVRPNARLELVAHTVARLDKRHKRLSRKLGRPLRRPGGPLRSLEELERRFGIRYLAPWDARSTGLPAGSIDFISSTSTLEHIPAEDVAAILAECRRLLRPDGILSCRIDLADHYSYADDRISPYNFLRFAPRTWRLLNSRLHFQNRLRRSDYLALFAAAGFDVVAEAVGSPTDERLAALRQLPLAEPFRGRPLEDLAVLGLRLVARPRATGSPDALEELEHVDRRDGPRIGLGARSGARGLRDLG